MSILVKPSFDTLKSYFRLNIFSSLKNSSFETAYRKWFFLNKYRQSSCNSRKFSPLEVKMKFTWSNSSIYTIIFCKQCYITTSKLNFHRRMHLTYLSRITFLFDTFNWKGGILIAYREKNTSIITFKKFSLKKISNYIPRLHIWHFMKLGRKRRAKY